MIVTTYLMCNFVITIVDIKLVHFESVVFKGDFIGLIVVELHYLFFRFDCSNSGIKLHLLIDLIITFTD